MVRPRWQTTMSAPAFGHRRRVVLVEDIGRRQHVPWRGPWRSCRPRARRTCRSPRGWRGTCRRSGRRSGKFCTPEKPMRFSSSRKTSISRNGSVAQTPARTGVLLHDRQHLGRHLDHDRVRVAIGHEAREAAAPGHPVAAGIVDDDEVDAPRLLALGRKPGARRRRRRWARRGRSWRGTSRGWCSRAIIGGPLCLRAGLPAVEARGRRRRRRRRRRGR